jgi:hypothetical protein
MCAVLEFFLRQTVRVGSGSIASWALDFVASFLAYKRNEIERFERFVTDWEFREYAYHR